MAVAPLHTIQLRGGPLDGLVREISAVMRTEFTIPCPWGGEFFHGAAVTYSPDGHWLETRCASTDTGEALVDSPRTRS